MGKKAGRRGRDVRTHASGGILKQLRGKSENGSREQRKGEQ